MFAIRRAAARVITSRLSITPTTHRSITTLTTSVHKPTRSSTLPFLQKRWNSDGPLEASQAQAGLEEPVEPETTSAAQFDSADITPTESKEVPQTATETDPIVDEAIASVAAESAKAGQDSTRLENRAGGQPSKQLYVGNLFFDVTADDLRREFSRFGTITNLRIITDGRGLSKGFAYVDYLEQSDATQALQSLNQQVFEGRRLFVQYAVSKKLDAGPRMGLRNTGATAPPSRTLFIGNMSFDLSDQDLSKLFSGIKNILDVRVAIDRRTGQPRGFAHADFTDIESAELAFKKLNNKEVYGRQLRCDYSGPSSRVRPRSDDV